MHAMHARKQACMQASKQTQRQRQQQPTATNSSICLWLLHQQIWLQQQITTVEAGAKALVSPSFALPAHRVNLEESNSPVSGG